MTPQELRTSIFQYAVQGKLVDQRPEEGTGEELFQQIQAEGNLEEATTKRRGKKGSAIQSADQEDPFDIPDTWKWVKLGHLGYTNIGLTYSPKDVRSDGVIVLRSSNIQDGKMDYDDLVKVSCEIPDNKMCHIGDILICARNGSKRLVGKAAIIDKEGMSFGAFMAIFRSICNPYILHVINSAYFRNTLLGDTGTTTINQITQDMLKNVLIPLPPLAEQMRIVTKLEEILPLIDRYEAAWNKLEEFNKRFPDDMQKSILQLAIQGKLVEQRPEEGSGEDLFRQIQAEKQALIADGKIKKEKPLPEITEDEIPFEIPATWRWVRWGELSKSIQYGYNAAAKEKGRIKMVRISDIQDRKVLWETVPYCDIAEEDIPGYLLSANDILFARTGGTVGKSYLVKDVPDEAVYAGYLIRTQYSSMLCPEYMKYFMDSKLYWDQLRNGTIATAQPNCNGQTLSKMILPLPPLAEQKRIVAKLEEILPLCDRLK